MWSWKEEVISSGGNRVGRSAMEEEREQVMSRDTAQLNWLEPRDEEGSKGNQAVWEGYGQTVKL